MINAKNMNKEMENKVKETIIKAFEQTKKRKPIYISDKLKQLYPKDDWTVICIKQKITNSYTMNTFGILFFCRYKNYRIVIYPSKLMPQETGNSRGEDDDSEKSDEEIISLNKEISDIKDKLKEAEKTIKKYELALKGKDTEIENLKKELDKNKQLDPFHQTFYTRDQMFALNFISSDSRLHFAYSCLKKDLFVDIEKKLYEEFPEYKETNNSFVVDGKAILRFKSIEENNLKSGTPILLIQNKNNLK